MFPRACLLLLLVSVPAVGQDAAPATAPAGQADAKPAPALPPLPSTPEEIMAAATPLYDFFSPSVKPWHMKVSYQLYDVDSKPTEQGVYEYWWSSPKTYRRSFTRGTFTDSEWYVDGKHYWSKGNGTLDYSERDLILDLLPILPDLTQTGNVKWELTSKERKVGNLQLPCVEGSVANSPLPAGTTYRGRHAVYCFDRAHPMIVAIFDASGIAISYGKLIKTQGRVLAREVGVYFGPRRALTASVDRWESITGTEAELTPPAGLQPLDPPAVMPAQSAHLPILPGVAQGLLVSATKPVYPEAAKMMRLSGVVVLHAMIGTDGRVHDLSVLSGDKMLTQAALDSVSQWRYKPYTLDGRPVEVDTTINVVFNLGGRYP